MDDIEGRVIEIVSKQLAVSKDKITRASKLQDDLGADSLDTVELVMELEDGLDIKIPDEALDKIKTVGDVVDFVKTLAPQA